MAARAQQADDVYEVSENLTVIGRRPFVMPTVSQHLHAKLPSQPSQRPGK